MSRLTRSWQLMKQCFAVLKSDKQLMLFPLISALSCVLVSATIFMGGAAPYYLQLSRTGHQPQFTPAMIWAATLVFYLANYFVIVFFNVALVAVATERLAGRTATMSDGLSKAWERRIKIFEWALLAATVGTILQMIQNRLGMVGTLVAKLLGAAWGLASFFVAPVLVFEDLSPIGALKRSSRIFRETWGEDLVSQAGFGLLFFLAGLAGAAVTSLMILKGGAAGVFAGIAFAVIFFGVLFTASAALQGIFTAAAYQYAITKAAPANFSTENFSMAWGPKKRKRL